MSRAVTQRQKLWWLFPMVVSCVGCATASKDVSTSYVSPLQYQSYDCAQLAAEATRLHGRIEPLAGRLDEAASHDQAIAAAGICLFWPALFALGGTKDTEAEYARLKGEYDVVQQAAITQKCPGVVTTPAVAPAPPPVPPAAPAVVPAEAPPSAPMPVVEPAPPQCVDPEARARCPVIPAGPGIYQAVCLDGSGLEIRLGRLTVFPPPEALPHPWDAERCTF